MNDSKRRCANCFFFYHSHLEKAMQCRKNPPQATAFPNGNGLQIISIYPPTKETDWCGEFLQNYEVTNQINLTKTEAQN